MNKRIIGITILILGTIAVVAFGVYRQNARIYTDVGGKYSIRLPQGWSVQDASQATTSSVTLFVGPRQDNGEALMRMVVSRFDRTPESDAMMKQFTEEGFFQLTANNVKIGLNEYNETANEVVTMDGKKFYRIAGTYIGPKSQKEVTQELYITLTDEAYYLIGIDVYSKLWIQEKGYVLTALDSFAIF
ncbi:MAG: hypothetical protein KBC33_03640 [Candidatus Pacebacteria bacterium]|nr:hypothetical protein [Candidatus Paceibacterota bacterium]